jgi:hypothetical protein
MLTKVTGFVGRLHIAYNAALQAATVALATAGYRTSRDQHHSASPITAGDSGHRCIDREHVRHVSEKRNAAGYDRAGLVSDADAKAMRDLAQRLKADVVQWIKKHHPELLK